jgi:hypothetical protein
MFSLINSLLTHGFYRRAAAAAAGKPSFTSVIMSSLGTFSDQQLTDMYRSLDPNMPGSREVRYRASNGQQPVLRRHH